MQFLLLPSRSVSRATTESSAFHRDLRDWRGYPPGCPARHQLTLALVFMKFRICGQRGWWKQLPLVVIEEGAQRLAPPQRERGGQRRVALPPSANRGGKFERAEEAEVQFCFKEGGRLWSLFTTIWVPA